MKKKKTYNLLRRSLRFIAILLLLLCAAAVGLYYYIFSIPEPEGLSITGWPQRFTENFSLWTTYENGKLEIEEMGLKRLDEYGLWIQFIDEAGKEIYAHNKPADYPENYTAAQLLALAGSDYEHGYTVFVNSLEGDGGECSYLVGFPFDIGKLMLYYNGTRISRVSPVARLLMGAGAVALMLSIFVYSVWLWRKLSRVTEEIRRLSDRAYTPLKEKGMFHEIYAALNQMNRELRRADQVQKETERTRQEWIANITHDLKTPLSPIKGYAELLADNTVKDPQEIQSWGTTILKNIDHTEKLINDLKLTYQLESGSVPWHPKTQRVTRQVREWVIDLVNDPAFSEREITFESDAPQAVVRMDTELLRRAVQNLMVNALIHNPPETKVWVKVFAGGEHRVCILVGDNGTGISAEKQEKLFERYYRGTNTKEKPEGSGLGLAIAKQIVTLHGGEITVQSKEQEGTKVILSLPAEICDTR